MSLCILKRISVGLFCMLTLVCCISCDDDAPVASGPPVEGLVIYRQGNEQQIRLQWQPAQFAIEYRVLRAYESRGPYHLIGQSVETNWIDTDFPASHGEPELVFYRIAGVREDGQQTSLSNVVGYYHFIALGGTIAHQAVTPFGLPFLFWEHDSSGVPRYGRVSCQPSDIVRSQAICGDGISADQIMEQYTGQLAYSECDGNWMGELESEEFMRPGQAYWYISKSGSPVDIYLMGEVDDRGRYGEIFINDPTPLPPGCIFSTAYSWRISYPVSVQQLGLLEQGFTGGTIEDSDRIVTQDGSGAFAVYLTETGQWYPDDFEVHPGIAYMIWNKHAGHKWTYDYRP